MSSHIIETYNLEDDPSEKYPHHKNHKKHDKMTISYQKWEENFRGPDYPGLGSEGFKNLTVWFRIKRKLKYIFFNIDREIKFLLGIY